VIKKDSCYTTIDTSETNIYSNIRSRKMRS